MQRKIFMEISIIRHGKPEINVDTSISANEFITWIQSYNAATISSYSQPQFNTLLQTKSCKVLVSSHLPRSIDSAKAINSSKLILSDKLFAEAGLPAANWKLIKLSPKIWAIFFRILWLLGYSKNSESFKEFQQRALLAADKLIELASVHQRVLFVGHGIFNRLLVKELLQRGWTGPKKIDSKHWSLATYTLKPFE